ncbi:T9SS type B sorting domain-containing protein [uncultured Algibacter sp.]|uniref:T9SS type B sorting domain-containing protein n=1 Tax=uncultured Algibacter sp. TaxID=298659 RepID=UPI002621C63D|nr:T9SS type B sorting domain-containing protein [uncultured Algibacter sp.]
MKKPTFYNSTLVVLFLLLLSISSAAQTYKPFTVRKQMEVRGSMLVVGNAILGQDNQPFNDLTRDNQDISMQYIDIDSDASTFSSSSADLMLHAQADGSPTTCYRVAYAGLYWGAILQNGNRDNINQIKFKVPGTTTYTDITGEIIYDAIVSPIIAETGEPGNTPYACYAEVTDLLTGLTDVEGTYTVANIIAGQGSNFSTGLAAGWTLLVIYEDPNLHTKSFTSFDGFSHIFDGHQETIPVTGFTTPPAGNIDLQFAYGALDGDRTKRATKLEINGKEVTTPLRTANKFFGSVIENENGVSHPRNPFSINTLGYDTGFLEIQNAEPEFIRNNDTSADFRLQVARGQADPIFAFFSTFAVDVISPDIDLTKVVKNTAGDLIDGDDVVLGQQLFYEITYQSVGNDNVTQFTIKDILPDNIIFDPATDIDLTNAGGATLQSYDPATRTLIFNIPDGSVEAGDPEFVIRLAIQVVPNCYDLSQACSNEIRNQAFATYRGVINPTEIVEEGSFATTVCLGIPTSTNFIVDISNCDFEQTEVLCGSSVDLTAADGYDSYSWSTSPSGTPVISTGQTYTATTTGTYYVQNTTVATCISINEQFNVITYGSSLTNPVIPYADLLPICPNDGKVLPYIFLCGGNETRTINTNISDSVSIIWEQLDDTSCPPVAVDDCANEDDTCTWNQVGTGADYIADTAGEFRVVINYPGGCFSIFYFNVYQNLLTPTITAEDILCTTPGSVTVGGVPSGYEYSLDPNGPFQPSNTFVINTPGYYQVYIRQVGVTTNPCIFQTPSILVRERDFTVTTNVTQPNCNGDFGSISLAANDALPQYYFSIYESGVLVNSVGPILASDYTFSSLNPGLYTVNVTTDDGCTYTEDIQIIDPPTLTVTAAITVPLTCTDGEITIYPVGGTPPYTYYINSTTVSQDIPTYVVNSPGVYDITVRDFYNCSASTSITVDSIPEPVFTVSGNDILCYNDNSGEIQFNVTSANGYTIEYTIDNGVTYTSNPTFSNLSAGTYSVGIKYSLGGVECFSVFQDITITQPDHALTASGGVSELAGCGPSGEGRVRITNPQGGVPPYEYSFDNQTTWVSTNEAYVDPGTYTLYIRDSFGCIYPIPGIVLDPEPVPPTISIDDPNFNCDGTASTTVTVTNQTSNSYTFTYLIDGVENPNTSNPRVFLDVPEGSHTISVQYQLQTVPTFSNLLNEDFGSGPPTTTSGIASAYCFNDQRVTAPYPCGTRSVEDNQYSVASFFWRSDDPSANNTGAWYHFDDHTTNGADPDGRFLLVNIGSAAGPYGVLYSKPILDVIPNQDIIVDLYLANLMRTVNSDRDDPDFRIQLVDGSGTVIAEQFTGIIPKNEQWNFNQVTLNPGNNTDLTFVIRSGSVQYYGNDALIDDISVYQLPITCIQQVDFPFIVDPGNAFIADVVSTSDLTCENADDGTITIAAQNFDTTNGFQYSMDNGTTWITQLTSPVTVSGLAAGTYNIQVRYEDAVNTCNFSFTEVINAPGILGVSTSISPATCIDGATITATANGGTSAYTFELLDTALALIANIPNNGIITNVLAGSYIVRVTDANGCTETTALTINAPTLPTATISVASDYCFDSTNGATLIVDATGGQPPYEYSLNGGPFSANNTFNNLTPGTYDIIVRDTYGCVYNIPTQTIANQLTATAALTKTLDCTTTPDAEVAITVSGGTTPYTYEVSFNGGTFNTVGNPPYTYNNGQVGDYQYRITDALGCTTLTNVVTIQAITNPSATAITTDVFCNGDSTGVAVIDVDETLGLPPYQISFNGSAFTSQTVYNGLASGNYNYTVRDSNSCEFTDVATVNEPASITLGSEIITPITCSGAGNVLGAIQILNVTGGTPDYTYTLLDSSGNVATTSSTNPVGPTSSTNVTFNDLNFGNYYLRIIDANGCEYNYGPYLVASDVSELDIVTNASGSCLTGVDYNISIVNGTGPFRVRIYDGTTTFNPTDGVAPNGLPTSDVSPNERNHQFAGLQFDVSYVFEVLDINTGCSYSEQVSAVSSPSTISVTGTPTNVTCYEVPGLDDGSFDFTISSYNGNALSWEVFNNLTNTSTGITGSTTGLTGANYSDSVTGIAPGDYYLLVTETDITSTQCTSLVNFQITQPTELLLAEVVNTNANCNQDAQVVVNGSGGTPPYEYAFVEDGVTPNAGDWTSNNLGVLNISVNTNWDVYVRDTNGCAISTPIDVVILSDPLPSVTLPTFADNQCNSNGSSYTFTATPSGSEIAPVSYSVDGVNFQSSPTFIVSSDGTYTVTIQDGNGCTSTDTIVIYPPLNLTPVVTALPTCPNNDGEITVTGFGGSGVYTYEITAPIVVAPQASNIFSGLASGVYTLRITDTTTLCTSDANITLDAATPVTFSADVTNVTCNGGSDGTITVNLLASNDNPPYTYEIIAPIVVAPQTSNVFTGLATGIYTVRVTSGRNCFSTQNIQVFEATPIAVPTPTVVEYACASTNNTPNYATITVSVVSGGSGTYLNYEFIRGGVTVQFGSSNVYTESDFLGGTYTINVYDNNSCLGNTSATIAPYADIDTIDVNVDNPITCTTDEDISVTVNSIYGVPTNIQYTVEDIAGSVIGGVYSQTNTTGIFTGLPIGNYIITVINLDTGCSLQTTHYVNDPNTFEFNVDVLNDVTCFNAADGSVNITFIDRVPTPSDESGAFNYTIVDATGTTVTTGSTANAGPVTVSGLASGTYILTGTLLNIPFCTISENFTITAPTAPLTISETHTEITCVSGNNDGSISASATGGWPGAYEYQLEITSGAIITPYSTTSSFTDLTAGIYTVSVRDSQGCVSSTNVSLNNPPPINATIAATPTLLTCFGDTNATITVSNVTGGQGSNYTYTLNTLTPTISSSGPQISNIFTGLGAGTYNVTVIDGFNCVFTTSDITISAPTEIIASLVKDTSLTCNNDATLTLSATGGTGIYEYSSIPNFATVLGSFTTQAIFFVPAGTYQYYVRDANGCVAVVSNEITIDPLPALMVTLDTTNASINCAGDTTGVIVAEAEGGLGNYIYTLQDGAGNDLTGATQNSPGVFTDLPIGTYQVQVESGDCLEVSSQVTITEPSTPLSETHTVTPVTCAGGDDGIIEITATGGTGIIKYAISPRLDQFFDDPIFDNLAPGTYDIIVQDELGCYVTFTETLIDPIPVSIIIVPNSILPEVCDGDMNGEFSIDISGGNLPYSVSLDDINGTYTTGTATQTQFDFIGLIGGDHIVYVRDALDCESEWNITFPESIIINPEVTVEYSCTNNISNSLVTVTVDASNTDLSQFDYSLNGGPYQASNVFINVPAGIGHYIDVRHTNGCIQQTQPFDIADYTPLQLVLEDGAINEIVAVASGGTGDYEYTLNGESYGSTNTFLIYESGDYTVTVTDSNGCVAIATKYFEYVDVCITNYFTPNGDGNQDGWGPGCTDQYRDLTFDIFDRYGRKIVTLRVGEKWDGKYNGRELPTGDYWYVVKLNDEKDRRDFVGHFTLYR